MYAIISIATRFIMTIMLLIGAGYAAKVLLPVMHKALAERTDKGFTPFPRIS